jgi:dipeptidyl aminopeptidase/acylaminoacyl peptidase
MSTSRRLHVLAGLAVICLAVADVGSLQAQAKKPLDHSTYDIWNRITGQALSDDGAWALYSVSAEKVDGALYVRALQGSTEYKVPRGDEARFTEDTRFVVFKIKPEKAAVERATRARARGDAVPQDSLGILDLSNGNVSKVARVQSFQFPEEVGGWVAYQLIRPGATADSAAAGGRAGGPPALGRQGGPGGGRGGAGGARRREGSALIVRNLATGQESRLEDVTTYVFAKNGSKLAYARVNREGTVDGAYLFDTATGQSTPMLTGKGQYVGLTFDDVGQQVAFLSSKESPDTIQPSFALYHAAVRTPAARLVAKEGAAPIAQGWWLSDNAEPYFSRSGARLFFGTAPKPPAEKPDSTPDDEKVVLDVWNWKDPYLQPMQLRQLDQERRRNYAAFVNLKDGKVTQLANVDLPQVQVSSRMGDSDFFIAMNNLPYRQEVSWDGTYSDIYIVNAKTGQSEKILEHRSGTAQLSPDSRFIAWYDNEQRAWFAMSTLDKKPVNISKDLQVALFNELHDSPSLPGSYGSAGWTSDGRFLVYDAFDVWSLDPTARTAPRSITEEAGHRDQIRFRVVRLDPQEEVVRADRPLLLNAFDSRTKAEGFYRDVLTGNAEPQRIHWDNRSFGNPLKAEDANVLMFTRSTFQEFPDLHVSDLDFRNIRRISDVNPQQAQYSWGTAELVQWKSSNAETLQGVLYKPEGFDPSKKYPMMVYFYERMSDGLHNHVVPSPGGSSINTSFYVSRGYLVFNPDIPYRVGYPGESALSAVVPGVLSLLEKGFVDQNNIGVQGHSWGGYQISYLVTKTNIFKAAEAGAPVANMISAYGGIRWGTGMSRMFQYEKTQSRIGGTLWDEPLHFIENSPIFWADKVKTPLLMMHNDEDGAVPWEQGIEYFVALRRLGKPVWMLNYNGEDHGLRKMANRKDWTIRMQQFFDHYLKGEAPPVWLEEGVPAIKKGKTLGLELLMDKKPAKPITEERQNLRN